jgi:hypothetical protein
MQIPKIDFENVLLRISVALKIIRLSRSEILANFEML